MESGGRENALAALSDQELLSRTCRVRFCPNKDAVWENAQTAATHRLLHSVQVSRNQIDLQTHNR